VRIGAATTLADFCDSSTIGSQLENLQCLCKFFGPCTLRPKQRLLLLAHHHSAKVLRRRHASAALERWQLGCARARMDDAVVAGEHRCGASLC
jgi:hypothetical protein